MGAMEDEMVRWHHRLNGNEFEQTPRDSRGQRNWCVAIHGVTKNRIQLNKLTTRERQVNYMEERKAPCRF